jgi:hypothetical protein
MAVKTEITSGSFNLPIAMTSFERAVILACFSAMFLIASEHHGVVTFRGFPVPGAVVTATQGDHKLVTTTDEDGSYSFRDLADGIWTIEVQATGFAKTSREIGVVSAAPAPTWELAIAPPAAAKGATAPPATAGGRGAPQMTREQARAQVAAQDQASARAAAVAATSGGGGGDAVLSGSLGGATGGISAGNAVAGNRYNGNAAFSLDNSVWDATPFSITGIQTPKPSYAKGRVNISFGGPLKIPHLLSGKNGTFTLNYSMGRTRNATTSNASVPTAAERQGDFAGLPAVINDPTTGQPFPGNQIPASRLSPIALKLESYYPAPNSPAALNFQTALVSISNQDNLNARLNQTLSKKDRLSGGVGWQRANGTNPNFLGFLDTTSNYGINANIGWAHTFSKNVIQNLNFNFSRYRTQLAPYFAGLDQNIALQLGIQGTSGLPLDWGPPNLSFTNFSGLTDGIASLSRNQTSGLNYGLNVVRKKHQLNFGSNFQRQQINPLSDANGRGTFAFTGVTGYDFADFLLDLPSTASIRYGNAGKYFRTFRFGVYALDNWQISKAVTANFGIRWDYSAPYTELYDRLANLEVGPGFASVTAVVAGQAPGVPNSLIRGYDGGVSPSAGIAWRPFPKDTKHPTVVRLSYNLNHGIDAYSAIANNLSGQPPFAKVLSIAGTTANPLVMQTAFLNSPVTANTYAVDPNYRPITLENFQLMITRTLPMGLYATAGFFYLIATHLDQTSLPNSLAPGLTAPVNGPPAGFIYEQSSGRLWASEQYFQFGRNMASGFSASIYGMLVHATDTGALFNGGALAQNWLDLEADKATSTLIRPYIFGNWQFSSGQGKAGGTLLKGWKGALLKDWTVTNSISYRAGAPLTATIAGAIDGGTAFDTLRANATGLSLSPPPGSGEPFNLAAFAVPAAGTWGTAGRNTITGPAVWGINGSLGRVFRIAERYSADLRFDVNNLLNHVVINGWTTVVNSQFYGQPTGAQAMRSLTANLRFRF